MISNTSLSMRRSNRRRRTFHRGVIGVLARNVEGPRSYRAGARGSLRPRLRPWRSGRHPRQRSRHCVLLTSDSPVVLLVACQCRTDDGLDFLGHAGSIHPQAKRAIVIRWGDFEARRRMVEALVRGDLDRWLWRPEHPADEEFHLAVTDLLASWASGHQAATEAVQIVGDRWSQRGSSFAT